MFCDYNSLIDYAATLNKDFNGIKKALNEIESSFAIITSVNNWDSDTRDHIYNKWKVIGENFDVLNNKFLNITQYLDTVINNYKAIDQNLGNVFGN